MRVDNSFGMTVLYPKSDRFKLRKKDAAEEVFYDVVYLGKFASPDEYEEVSIYEIEGYNEEISNIKSNIDDLNSVSDEQDALIIDLATQVAILNLTL